MWLAIRYANKAKPQIGTMLPSMAIRDKQLGFDGAVEYRELFQRHPDVERGPDEELEHHLTRLRAVDKARTARYGAKAKSPSLDMLQSQLGGLQDALQYRRLMEDFPEVERGPDEDLSTHYLRLQRARTNWRGEDTTEVDRRAQDPRAQVVEDPSASVPGWVRLREQEARDAAPVDLKGMPQRIPGWFTGDAMDAPPPGHGTPPMSRRDPGATLRSPVSPSAQPQQQSMQDWINWLATKGITVDDQGRRAEPAGPLPHRPLTGPQIWQPFVGPTTDESMTQHLRELPEDQGGLGKSWRQRAKELFGRGRRTASTVVAEYIESVLVDVQDVLPVKTASLQDRMEEQGWEHHESGSGNWYQKHIGDQLHVIVNQPGGWIHNSGPSIEEMGENPMWFNDLRDAMMHAHRGQVQIGFSAKPPSIQRMNSWSDVQ